MVHHHNIQKELNLPPGARKVVLAGNPNAGKSVFFNALTGLYVDVSNYPGTTLEISHGRMGEDAIIDTPGVYGISSFSDEERIARDIILAADVVINVVNAVYLERDLFLTQQIIDTGVPVVVALNMIDEAENNGLSIDVPRLAEELGVPVVPTIAVRRRGLAELKAALAEACPGRPTPDVLRMLKSLVNRVGNQGDALLIAEGDVFVAQRHGVEPGERQEEIYTLRRRRVNEIVGAVVTEGTRRNAFSRLLGLWMIRPLTGIPILLAALWVMYKVIGQFVAGTVVGWTEEGIMLGYYEPAVRNLVARFVDLKSLAGEFLVGEFGLLTMTVTYVLGLLMPLVASFYFFLSLFEDSGYLPRIATLVDRLLTKIGLNGRAIIPLILGFGCVTMATIVTRLLGSARERKIAIVLLALAVPCSAQLAVIGGMLAGLGGVYMLFWAVTIMAVFIMAGTLLQAILPGKSTSLLIDLPPLRLPRMGNVLKKTTTRSFQFLKEATPLFALGAALITLFQASGLLGVIQQGLAPLTVGWLNLPGEAANAFVMGIVRRDFGAAGLYEMALTPVQTVTALITITLFVPCIASILVIFKELSKKEAALIWLGTWGIAFTVGGVAARVTESAGGVNPLATGLVVGVLFLAGTAVLAVIKGLRKLDRPVSVPLER
ncbi:ferrous iron transport protein B [Desulforudis sp. 1088]|uniref:ferrous iron transport protein B n=2 Tax=Candidatus Desulforudis TaxID=471826 RepID=UPI003CE4B047